MTTPGRVTLAELRALNYCASGIRAWCARYGLDFRKLVREGFTFEELEATGDHFGLAAVALARKRDERYGQ